MEALSRKNNVRLHITTMNTRLKESKKSLATKSFLSSKRSPLLSLNSPIYENLSTHREILNSSDTCYFPYTTETSFSSLQRTKVTNACTQTGIGQITTEDVVESQISLRTEILALKKGLSDLRTAVNQLKEPEVTEKLKKIKENAKINRFPLYEFETPVRSYRKIPSYLSKEIPRY